MRRHGKIRNLFVISFLTALFLSCVAAFAGAQEGTNEYEIYPTPHEITYGSGTVQVTDEVKLTVGPNIDTYTKTRIGETLETLGVKGNEDAASAKTSLTVGVYGSGDAADVYGKSNGAEAELFEKSDAYMLFIKGNGIVVLGKNTDAAFYGVTTLHHIFKQLTGKSVRELTIRDYSEVASRGFIEGYYGNPWSTEDRIDLMKFGGEIKMNQYIFAPKDDPYHNAQWRDKYPEEEGNRQRLDDLKRVAEAGNESKCFFVYALHPFMNNAINFGSNYAADLKCITDKFEQLLGVGVRQFAILEDDATGTTAANIIKLMTDLSNWIKEQQKTYPDLRSDILYCPTSYMSMGDSKIKTISEGVGSNVHIMVTGGKVWGEVTNEFADTFHTNVSRWPYMWVNWPCNDNTKNSLIMGGHNQILHAGLDGTKYEGVVLNPMQFSEPSKVGIFTAADFCWNTWEDAAEGDQAWNDSFKYIDHLSAVESDEATALREHGKHMIHQGPSQITPGKQVSFDESLELSPKLTAFQTKLESGQLQKTDLTEIREEFQKLNDAANLYLKQGKNAHLLEQIPMYLHCWADLTQADVAMIDALGAKMDGDDNALWEYFSIAQSAYEQSQSYGFLYVDHTEYAAVGTQYIVPFTQTLHKYLSNEVRLILDPEHAPVGADGKYEIAAVTHTTAWSVYGDNPEKNLTDGNDDTYVWYQSGGGAGGNTSMKNDFLQVDLGGVRTVGRVRVVVGTSGKSDKWTNYHLEYSSTGKDGSWTSLTTQAGNASGKDIYDVNLENVEAQYIRLVNDQQVDKWLTFGEFSVYAKSGGGESGQAMDYTNTVDGGWTVEYGDASSQVTPRQGAVLKPGEYIGLALDRIHDITSVTVSGSNTDKLTLEQSLNQTKWVSTKTAAAARYIRLMNNTTADVTFDLDSFVVTSREIGSISYFKSTIAGSTNEEDPRNAGTTGYWFDGDLSTTSKYCVAPQAGQYITYDLGQTLSLNAVKVYVLDTDYDYPRDAEIRVSTDGQNWKSILTIGDGQQNDGSDASTKPAENGYTHDTVDPSYSYVENKGFNETARYIQLYFTASYTARWIRLNEIQLNGGEYFRTINDPTFETDPIEARGYAPQNLNDLDLTTAFKPNMEGKAAGSLIYKLSESTKVIQLNILQSGRDISHASVSIRASEDGAWEKIGTLDKSLNTFHTVGYDDIYEVKLEWENATPVIYEIIALTQTGTLQKNIESIADDVKQAESALSAAKAALGEAQGRANEAANKVTQAKTALEKLQAEMELANANAAKAAAEAVVAENEAALAEIQATAAQMQGRLLTRQAEQATSEADRSQLEAQAQEKMNEAEQKLLEAQNKRTEVSDKQKEQNSYLTEATNKKNEISSLQESPDKSSPDKPEPSKKTVTTATVKNVNYRILNATKKTAVAYGIANKNAKSLSIAKTVKIGGVTYKVTQIGAKAFKNCKKLTKVTVGANVQSIGKEAFAGCKKLKSVNLKKASKINSFGRKAFSKTAANLKIKVPAKQLKTYKKKLSKTGISKKTKISK